MSDRPQGPGWWLASDGRWYPPESRLAQPPPPPGYWPPPGYGPPPGASVPPPGWRPAGYPGWAPPGQPQVPPTGASVAAPDPVTGQLLAPWWKRLVATLVDAAILGAAAYLLEIPFLFIFGVHAI